MFLLAITNSDITDRMGSYHLEEFRIHSARLTIIFDDFLSKVIPNDDGFSVIESPLVAYQDPEEIVLSQVKYIKEKGILEIHKPLISGRPIYYHLDPKGNFYCSTHISMLRQAGVNILENTLALPEFLAFRYVMAPQTLYKEIQELAVGSQLNIRIDNGKCIIESITDFDPPEINANLCLVKYIWEKASVLHCSSLAPLFPCKDRIVALLSGGLDSTILVKICQTLGFDVGTTYSTGYPFEQFEKEYALSAAEYLGTNHRYHETTNKEYLIGLIEAISIAEQPLLHMQSVLLHLLFRDGIPKTKHIVLSGQRAGIDSSPPSSTIFHYKRRSIIYNLLKIRGTRSFLSHLPQTKWAIEFQTKIDCPVSDPNNILWFSKPVGSFDWISEKFNVTKHEIIKNRLLKTRRFEDRPVYEVIPIHDVLGDNANTQSTWARIGEAHQKIVHYPFNHPDLINLLISIPSAIKHRGYKYILRGVARHYGLPEFIITRPKLGFNPQTTKALLEEKLFEPLIPVASKVFDEQQIRKLQSCDWDYKFWTFWNILNYSIWKRLCINNEATEVLLEELTEI